MTEVITAAAVAIVASSSTDWDSPRASRRRLGISRRWRATDEGWLRAADLALTAGARSLDVSRQPCGMVSAMERGDTPQTWSRFVTSLVRWAGVRGLDGDALLQSAGLGGTPLDDLDQRIPLEASYALVEAVDHVLADPDWPVAFARGLDVSDLDALGFLFVTSPTLGEGLERMLRYQRVWNEGERLSLRREDGEARVVFEPYGPPRVAHGVVAEVMMIDVVVHGARLVHRSLAPRAVRFRHVDRGGTDLCPVFGAPVEYGAAVTEVVLPASSLALPLPGAHAAMCQFFERHVQGQLDTLPGDRRLADRVRTLVEDMLHAHTAGVSSIAASLRMSERTLQRRLREEGTRLADIVEQVRRERAELLLRRALPLGEVAFLLGYSEPSAFHRAFRRWHGMTPQAYRSQLVGECGT